MKTRIWLMLMLVAAAASAGSFRYGAATITVGTPVLVGNKTGRADLSICNRDSTNPVYCGDSSVTSSTGMPVNGNSCASQIGNISGNPSTSTKDVYCVATGGSVDIRFWENTQ